MQQYKATPPKTAAITIKKITGFTIPTIPAGTAFTVTNIHEYCSVCQGLPINIIWNNEYATDGDI